MSSNLNRGPTGLDFAPGQEPERYEAREPAPYAFELSRRQFVQALGAGLVFSVVTAGAQEESAPAPARGTLGERLHVGQDGRLTLLTGKVEVGQGARTELAQAVAEELRLPIERIDVVMADTERTPNDGGTFGSLTTPRTVPTVRRAAAAARQALLALAAARWGCDAERLRLEGGEVDDPATGLKLTLAELVAHPAAEATLRGSPVEGVEVRRVEDWTFLGRPQQRKGAEAIVTGTHRYPSDIRLPGMLYGAVLRPASYGARLLEVDLSAAEAFDGVKAVRDGEFVGCYGPTSSLAALAVEALAETARWERPPHPSSRELFAWLKEHAEEGRGGRSRGQETGSVEAGLAAAARTFEATYEIAYIQHAPMEPRSATAQWDGDRLTVWTATQRPFDVRGELARAFRLRTEDVRLIVPDAGGGFGGKHSGECAVEAARLARAAGRAVKLTWSREEEFAWAYFRPAGVIEARAGLDAQGRLTAWQFVNVNSGASALATPYAVPHVRQEFRASQAPLRQGSYRALAATANVFAREAFMDELAAAAGEDPLAFRLKHLTNERLAGVLRAAAERFGWAERRKALAGNPTRGVGIACGTEKGSYAAACAEVEVDLKSGTIRPTAICQAFECGKILNPAGLRAQVEGCVVMGLGGALTEAIEFEGGRLRNGSFAEYRVPRLADVPPIEIALVDRPDLPSAGAGETPIVAVAPALANAAAAATGRRLRGLPLRL